MVNIKILFLTVFIIFYGFDFPPIFPLADQSNSLRDVLDEINLNKEIPTLPEDREARIIITIGSYDPPHLGHLSVVEAALKDIPADFIIVILDDVPNPNKPNRTDYNTRAEMLKVAFGDEENVYVSIHPKEEVKEKLSKVANVMFLMGTDVWSYHKYKVGKESYPPYKGLIVCTRKGYDDQFHDSIGGVEVKVISASIEGLSSTKVRNYLRNHPEVYENKSSLIPGLSSVVSEYILENRLYSEE